MGLRTGGARDAKLGTNFQRAGGLEFDRRKKSIGRRRKGKKVLRGLGRGQGCTRAQVCMMGDSDRENLQAWKRLREKTGEGRGGRAAVVIAVGGGVIGVVERWRDRDLPRRAICGETCAGAGADDGWLAQTDSAIGGETV